MRKFYIKNRKNQRISVLVEGEEKNGPLAFVMHGLGGWKDQSHIKTFSEAFLENGFTSTPTSEKLVWRFTVVRFDTTNTYGESEGAYEDATTTNYYEDLEDVVFWAKGQAWYTEPFWLAGHSLGGMCTALFAERYPEKVAGLAPISTVVSGKLSKGRYTPQQLASWEKTGLRRTPSESIPGLVKKLKWSHMTDRMNYDLLPKVDKLTMPVLLIVGEYDDSTPPEHQKIFFDALQGPKELHIIKGAKHTFTEPKHLAEIKTLFDRWIKRYAKK